MDITPCPTCGGRNLFRSEPQTANGGYGPELLPGLGPWYRSPRLDVVVCGDCGLMRFFASSDAVERLPDSGRWKRV